MRVGSKLLTVGILTTGLVAGSALAAAPTLSAVSGTIAGDSQITLTGTNFGTGPSVVLFDDFGSGTDGQTHNAAAVVGTWSNTAGKVFSDAKLSKGKGMRVVDSNGAFISKIVFPAATDQVYASYVGYVPDGWKFPTAPAEEQYAAASSLKVGWLMYGSDGYSQTSKSDYVIVSWTGAKWTRVGSNDSGGPSTFDNNGNVGWIWDEPVRWAFWAKGNGTSTIGTDGLFQATNGQAQVYRRYTDYKPWFLSTHTQHQWDRMNFAGYVRSTASFASGENFVLDDIYVATGANATARVEIGNASTYANCTKLTLVTTGATGDSWSNTSITATIRQGTFTNAELNGAYVYVTNGACEVNAVGYQVFAATTETIELDVIGDTQAIERYKSNLSGTQSYLYATPAANDGKSMRPMLQFDISEVKEEVNAASLWIYCKGSNAEVTAFPMISADWDEDNVSWNYFDSVLSLSWLTGGGGGDFEPTIFSSALTGVGPNFEGWVEIDVTELVQAMVDEEQDIGAFLLLSDKTGTGTSGGDGTYVSIRTKDYGTGSLKAQLIVESTGY